MHLPSLSGLAQATKLDLTWFPQSLRACPDLPWVAAPTAAAACLWLQGLVSEKKEDLRQLGPGQACEARLALVRCLEALTGGPGGSGGSGGSGSRTARLPLHGMAWMPNGLPGQLL